MEKKKTVLIIALLICLLLIGAVLYLKFGSAKTNNLNSDDNTNKSFTLKKGSLAQKLYTKLYEYGNEIYETKKYENYEKRNDGYFISLKKLKDDFGYDISIFVDDSGKKCDEDNSGIIFDLEHKIMKDYPEGYLPVLSVLDGCNPTNEIK